jgi:diguanylate cyclase (GGDEF)-like protein
VRSYRISRLVAVGLALTLIGLIVLSLLGAESTRRASETVQHASAMAAGYIAADEALTTARPADDAGNLELATALVYLQTEGSAEDRAVVARVRELDAAYRAASRRMRAASEPGAAERIRAAEVAPTFERLDAELVRAEGRNKELEQEALGELRRVVGLTLGVAVLSVPVGVGLVVMLTLMVTRYQRSLRRQSDLTAHQALHDSLTGLPNRGLFVDRLSHALATSRRSGTGLAVMMLDMDRFKEVNDTLGHMHGDDLLRQISDRLRSTIRETDAVARLSGDEFAVLLPGADADAAGDLAERVLDALHRSFVLGDVTVDVEASIGVALAPAHGDTAEAVLRSADEAMCTAKDAKTGIVMYQPAALTNQPNRLLLLGELRRALDESDQLVLFYQPKVSLDVDQICGVEALIRWRHPTRGMVPPNEFIPVAESTGLINRLTDHVLELAVAQGREWLDSGLRIPIAVNLSPRCLLDASLLDRVRALLDRHALPAEMLRLEVTETAVMANPTLALATLSGLHELGVRLSIDDYGTGYSSMAYLKRLPVDELKVDRSFVLNMTDNDNDAILVRSAIDLGHNLGLSVVAEGVERAEHVAALSGLSCDIAQGYHYARPMPPQDLREWLATSGPATSTSVPATG